MGGADSSFAASTHMREQQSIQLRIIMRIKVEPNIVRL
jgi:hypothetical protein